MPPSNDIRLGKPKNGILMLTKGIPKDTTL